MERTQIYITEDQKRILKKLSEEKGVSVAELIRDAIDEHLQSVDAQTFREALSNSFGAWREEDAREDRSFHDLREEWAERSARNNST